MFLAEHFDPAVLGDRLRDADTVTPQLLAEVIDLACRRFPSTGQTAKTARIEELIDARAWTDVALALIDLELPSFTTTANGIARCLTNVSFQTGSISTSRRGTRIWPWRS